MNDLISREKLLNEINLLKKSPWYNKDFAAAKIVRKDAVAAVEMCIKEAPSVTGWIKCSDRLPDEIGKVLVIDNGKIDINSWAGKYEGWYYTNKNITHWMPLPPKPESIEVQHE
jgi:hypothetical protein